MTLNDSQLGQPVRILSVVGDTAICQRILEMGLTDGEIVELVAIAPMGDPLEIRVRGYHLSLRRAEARNIQVTPAE